MRARRSLLTALPTRPGPFDLLESLLIAVELRELRLVVEPFVGVEDAGRGLPGRAADSGRTPGIVAVEEAREALACGWRPGGPRRRDVRDVVSSSGRAARDGLGGPCLGGGRGLGGAARLQGLPLDSPLGPLGPLGRPPLGLRLSLLGSEQPLHSLQLLGGLRTGEEATERRVRDAVVGGEVTQRLVAGAAAKQRLVGDQLAQFGH